MSYDIKLAKHLKDRDNVKMLGPVIGTIVNVNPIKISILDGKIILDDSHIYLVGGLSTNNANIILNNVADHGAITTAGTIKITLNKDDKVLCLPTADSQSFFIIK